MTREQIIENLESYKVNLKRIEYIKRKIKEFQETAYSLHSGYGAGSGVGSSKEHDASFCNKINNSTDYEKQLTLELISLQEHLRLTTAMIDMCRSNRQRDVLNLFYVDGMKAKDISLLLDITERQVHKLKSKAITNIQKSFD